MTFNAVTAHQPEIVTTFQRREGDEVIKHQHHLTAVTRKDQARVLMNASMELANGKLIDRGVDLRVGFEALACGLAGASESGWNVGWSGHDSSIKRINRRLQHDQEATLVKVGELSSFGYGYWKRPHIQLENGTTILGKEAVLRGRSVWVPAQVAYNGNEVLLPQLLFNEAYQQKLELVYLESDHCHEGEWEIHLRQMQGIFLLWLIQENNKTVQDKTARFSSKLAKTLEKDAEAGIFLYLATLETSNYQEVFHLA